MSRKVHEFDALWTTQVTQKRKKWNDGRIKFHYFNKRVVLYDENDVYVADMFHNKPNLIVDDELNFDRFLATVTADNGLREVNITSGVNSNTKAVTSKKRTPLVPRREVPNTNISLSQVIKQSKRCLTTKSKSTDISVRSVPVGNSNNVLDNGQSASKTNSVMQLEFELSQTLDSLQEPYMISRSPEIITSDVEEENEGDVTDDENDFEISNFAIANINHQFASEYGPWSKEAFDLFDIERNS